MAQTGRQRFKGKTNLFDTGKQMEPDERKDERKRKRQQE